MHRSLRLRRSQLGVLFVVACSATASLRADDLEPTLGKRGKLLYEETFAGPDAPQDWTFTVGKLTPVDGALALGEQAKDMHAGAFRRRLAVQDCAVQFDFRFDGAKTFNFGYDPAPGELKKKGHLFSVVISPENWSLVEHLDKANPESKPQIHARAAEKFEPGRTYTILIESRGPNVTASVAGKKPLRGTAADFAVKKPGLVFRVTGDDGTSVRIDDVKVWELN